MGYGAAALRLGAVAAVYMVLIHVEFALERTWAKLQAVLVQRWANDAPATRNVTKLHLPSL